MSTLIFRPVSQRPAAARRAVWSLARGLPSVGPRRPVRAAGRPMMGQLRCTGAPWASHVVISVRCSHQCCCAGAGASFGGGSVVGRGMVRLIFGVVLNASGLGFFADDRRGRCPPCPTAARGGGQQNPTLVGRGGWTAGPPRVRVGGIDAKSDLASIGTGRRCWRSGVQQWAGSGFCCPTRPTIFN